MIGIRDIKSFKNISIVMIFHTYYSKLVIVAVKLA